MERFIRKVLTLTACHLFMFYVAPAIASTMPRQLGLDEAKAFLLKLEKRFPDEKYTIISKEDDGTFFANDGIQNITLGVWKADINNDGIEDYALIIYGQGSGHYDSFIPYIVNKNGILQDVELGLQENAWPSNVASPPILYENGKTYVLLEGIHSESKKGEALYAGANSNAAVDAYYLVTDMYKYYIRNNTVRLVSRKSTKSKLLQ